MKKIFCLFILFCLAGSAAAQGLNVLILRRAPQAHMTARQNYFVVTDQTAYGPFPPDSRLTARSVEKGLRLSIQNAGNTAGKTLPDMAGPVRLVRAADRERKFTLGEAASARPLADAEAELDFDAQAQDPFFTLRQEAYGGDITYSGPLTLFAKRGINVVENTSLENYVTQVTNCELGGSKSLEALKTQAVLVRTFALFIVQQRLAALTAGNQNWRYFQLFSTPVDQAYNCRKRVNNREAPSALLLKAVAQTAGEVLLKNGKPARVQYNTCAAGKLPPGVICQEKVMQMAKKGKTYKQIFAALLPGREIGPFDMASLYTQTLQSALQSAGKN